MEYCEQPSLAMTHLSMKIGRFICDSAVEVSNAKIFNGSNGGFRCNGGYDEEEDDDDDEEEGDDVIPGMRTHSSSDLRGLCRRSRRFDVSDVRIPRFESDEPEPEVDDRNGSDVIPWLDYDYDRTLRPFKNDRILNLLSRVVRSMNFASGDDGSPPEADKGQGEGGGGRVAEPEDDNGETVPLPWRSTEAMSAVEDSSKYLREKEEEATAEAKDEDDNYEEDPPSQSLSSLSGSSSFRNIPSSDSYDAVPRPDHLSAAAACHYSGGLSLRLQWLSEAESRHSDLFCPAHHRPASPPEPSSIRSSVVVTGHRLHPQPRRRYRPRDRHSQSNYSHSGSSAEMPFPTVVDEDEEEEEGAGSPNQRHKVLQWLLASDLEVTAQLDEADDDRLSDVVCSGGPSIASGWSRPRIVRDDNGDE